MGGGDNTVCVDCLGVPYGDAQYDECDICDGDSTACLDCRDVPFGTSQYDVCGVCEGDGSSCSLTIGGYPVSELDYALYEWSLQASISKLEATKNVLEGVKDELCRYDVNSGRLSDDLSNYLDSALEFKEILNNYLYVQLYAKDEKLDPFLLDKANETP